MTLLKVQLNHPGRQKPFKIDKGYFEYNNTYYREWNSKKEHYRKFLCSPGKYIATLDDLVPIKNNLYFWGEWEGYSRFTPLPQNEHHLYPNGVHVPIYSPLLRKGEQNTDPYIFGDYFKYATCKQIGLLRNLQEGSLLLFGSTYPKQDIFVIDTVFVVKNGEQAKSVNESNAAKYSKIYVESTLKLLNNEYLGNLPKKQKKIYRGQLWSEDATYFSFVPCKLDLGDWGFERLKISISKYKELDLSSYSSGKSYLNGCKLTPKEVWEIVCEETMAQGFTFGIEFDEPQAQMIKVPKY